MKCYTFRLWPVSSEQLHMLRFKNRDDRLKIQIYSHSLCSFVCMLFCLLIKAGTILIYFWTPYASVILLFSCFPNLMGYFFRHCAVDSKKLYCCYFSWCLIHTTARKRPQAYDPLHWESNLQNGQLAQVKYLTPAVGLPRVGAKAAYCIREVLKKRHICHLTFTWYL